MDVPTRSSVEGRAWGWGKVPAPIVEKDRDARRLVIGYYEVNVAIAVEIPRINVRRFPARYEGSGAAELPGSVSEEHGHGAIAGVRHSHVKVPVAVEIGYCNRPRTRSHIVERYGRYLGRWNGLLVGLVRTLRAG